MAQYHGDSARKVPATTRLASLVRDSLSDRKIGPGGQIRMIWKWLNAVDIKPIECSDFRGRKRVSAGLASLDAHIHTHTLTWDISSKKNVTYVLRSKQFVTSLRNPSTVLAVTHLRTLSPPFVQLRPEGGFARTMICAKFVSFKAIIVAY